MLPLEKSLIQRLGNAGWVLFWLPRLHTISKIYSIESPPYRKEAHEIVKKINTDIQNFYRREKTDLDRRKDLPISNLRHLSREKYQRAIAALNKKREDQKTGFLKDNVLKAAKEIEVNLAWDAFEAGMTAYASGDFRLADGLIFLRRYVEQDNPQLGRERIASLFHELRRYIKKKRRDWVPKEMAYIEDFIRLVKGHYKRLGKVAFWDGADYRATLEKGDPPERESYKQSLASELTDSEITKIMDLLYFKFEHHKECPLSREDYDNLKGIIIANYDFKSQLGREDLPGGSFREYYIKPPITSIRI
jgi:hypothetical protein